ncbi:MAG: hypothetical protein GC171_09560 [Terrimonas sp.]|nr:hypothetical protein [Terrimonas sp.]
MKKNLRYLFLFPLLLMACRKQVEDRLIGQWRLDKSYKKDLFGRDYFQTGYEDGIFHFYESGAAGYTSNTDTLSGYWEAGFYSNGNFNAAAGQSGSHREKFLRINLVNFQTNKIFYLDLDEFHYRNNWNCIRGTEHTYGRDRIYEFVKP